MQKPSQRTLPDTHSFTIHINDSFNHHQHHNHNNKTFIGFSSSMKLFSKFRKILMKIIFIVPSSSSSSATVRRHKTTDSRSGGERLETPKISCSNSYYSSQSHYSEAISDCIDFFNKSSVNNMSHHQEREDKIVHEQDCFYV
ncbi:hypothetical protein N665_0064s0053 [Sinapis alba]|nr:hypothetical protein N665_0064s0053 [Sinapis alba]